jgi:hypothetical protein
MPFQKQPYERRQRAPVVLGGSLGGLLDLLIKNHVEYCFHLNISFVED